MEILQCQLQDFVDSVPIIPVSNATLSINQGVNPQVSCAFTRVPLIITKFGVNHHGSAINSTPDLSCVLA